MAFIGELHRMKEVLQDQVDEIEEVHLLDYVLVLLKRKKLIAAITCAISLLSIIYVLVIPPIYEGTARILPPSKGGASMGLLSQLSSIAGMASALPGMPGTPSDLYVGMLTDSRTIADAMIDRFKLMEVYDKDNRVDTRNALSKRLRAMSDRKSGIITITVEDEDPKRAADMANAFVEELAKINNTLAVADARQKRLFFEGQLKETITALRVAEEDLKSFQEKTGAIQISSQAGAVVEGIASLRAQIAAKEIQIKVMRTYFTENSRDVRRAEEELAGMKEQLKKLEAGGDKSYGSTIIPTGEVPALSVEYLRKLREFKFQETLYEMLSKMYESARLDEASDVSSIQVVDSAVVPEKRSKPKRTLTVVLATVLGFFFAVLASFFAEYWEKMSQSPEDCQRLEKIREHLDSIRNNRALTWICRVFKRGSGGS